ncbi:MAG: alkaline phosphatase family protein [Gammaproteobacteria bacterium]|nr:alkaline phosphatase family protein [Gammaproteobacteria bacterium]
MKNVLPDYSAGSLVNLISSLRVAMGGKIDHYPTASLLAPHEIEGYDNIVFMLLDGLGYNSLRRHGDQSFINKHCIGSLTSVFPSTTSTAISTVNTGTAAQQHTATGWFVYWRELATVAALLPFKPRIGGEVFSRQNITINQLMGAQPFYSELKRDSYVINHNYIVDSDYSVGMTRGAKRKGYASLQEFYSEIEQTITADKDKKYIFAYWPEFDGLCHTYGVYHQNTHKHFNDLDQGLEQLATRLAGSNTLIVVTADHGLIDTAPEYVIRIEDYPEIAQCLRIPLCGEPRACYCYVKPEAMSMFADLCETQLGQYCDCVSAQQLIDDGYFGLGEANALLKERVGDFVLLLKGNYVIKDRLLSEKPFTQIGVHGGLSEDEMLIPLVVVKC